jgi:hypothetical protein
VPGQNFTGFEAAHISPLLILIWYSFPCVFYFNFSFSVYSALISHSLYVLLKFLIYVASNSISQWRSGQWSQIIEDDMPESDISESKIHSIQNGLLLLQTPHAYFDKYMITINPDVRMFISTYKITLMCSRIIIKSPVSLKTFLATMVGT